MKHNCQPCSVNEADDFYNPDWQREMAAELQLKLESVLNSIPSVDRITVMQFRDPPLKNDTWKIIDVQVIVNNDEAMKYNNTIAASIAIANEYTRRYIAERFNIDVKLVPFSLRPPFDCLYALVAFYVALAVCVMGIFLRRNFHVGEQMFYVLKLNMHSIQGIFVQLRHRYYSRHTD